MSALSGIDERETTMLAKVGDEAEFEAAPRSEQPLDGDAPRPTARRLKVAYLVNQYPHTSHTFIRREIRALESLGVDVVRLSSRRSDSQLVDPADQEELTRTTVLLQSKFDLLSSLFQCAVRRPAALMQAAREALSIGRRSRRGLLRHVAYLAQACLVVEKCRERNVDHLHAHFATNPATVALLARILGGPTFSLTIHGPEEFDQPLELALDRKIEHARFVAAISEFTRSQLCRWTSFEHWSKLQIVRCGLDRQFLDVPRSPVPNVRRLICVGRLCEQKGQITLIEAVARLKSAGESVEVVIVGDGPMRPDLERRIAELQLEDRVILAGWRSGDWIRQEILKSRAMVLPSFAEGLPVVLMEALALSRPVITTFIAGIPELVEPSVNGWLVPAGSVSALAAAMQDVLSTDPVRLSGMGEAGAARVNTFHNALTEAGKLASLFAHTELPARA